MAGIYLHIPFCRSKCDYCDFFSMPVATACRKGEDIFRRYVDALIGEFHIRAKELKEPVRTVYIGGGTPTALPGNILEELVQKLLSSAGEGVEIDAEEVTVEGNPEDITAEKLRMLKDAGVNRVSIGIQSFSSEELRKAGRHHDGKASERALETLAADGINYNADLIFGLPGQSVDSWHRQLSVLLGFRPPHVSSYLLSYEPSTKLYARKEKGKIKETEEATAVEMYRILCEEMARNGYEHYEISNFALPGCYSRHNSSYWNLTPYLGLGCSAHSFDGQIRRFNPSGLVPYLNKIEKGEVAAEIDEEGLYDRINDYIITSLRTSRGMNLELIEKKWGSGVKTVIMDNVKYFVSQGKLIEKSNRLIIPEEHWLTADGIMRELLLD